MPWKHGYTMSDERTLADVEVVWPEGRTCFFGIVVDLSPACGPEGITAADLETPEHYYGMHGGLDAVRQTLDRQGLRATFAVPGVITDLYPGIVGSLHEDVSLLMPAEEETRIDRTTAAIGEATGLRPSGWYTLPRASDPFATGTISDATVPLLLAAGTTTWATARPMTSRTTGSPTPMFSRRSWPCPTTTRWTTSSS